MSRKKENLAKSILVSSEDALKNAVKVGYGEIVVSGEYANRIASSLRTSDTGNKLSNVGLVVGLFVTPVFLASIVGKMLTKDLSKYETWIMQV